MGAEAARCCKGEPAVAQVVDAAVAAAFVSYQEEAVAVER